MLLQKLSAHKIVSSVLACTRDGKSLQALGSAGFGGVVAAASRYVTGSSLHEEDDKAGRPTTPWVRQVISGVDLMRHPKYNKGLGEWW